MHLCNAYPIFPESFALTQVIMITCFSLPWKLSTVDTSIDDNRL